MDKDKLFKDNVLLINENYKLSNQITALNNLLKSAGMNKDSLRELVDKLRVIYKFYIKIFNYLDFGNRDKIKR